MNYENNTRKKFFGKAGDISKNYSALKKEIKNFRNYNVDIRDKPKYMPVNLGEAYRLRELDSTIKELTEVEDKLACLTKNFVGKELNSSNDERFGMPTFDGGHSN